MTALPSLHPSQPPQRREARPAITVVVPTRNRRALLAATLSAVLAQQGVELEVIVVDEASADGTAGLLRNLQDERVRTVRNDTPMGVAAARNRGLAMAVKPWVAFCDDDDLWAPWKLHRQVLAAEAAGRAWALSGVLRFTSGSEVMRVVPPCGRRIASLLPFRNAVPGGGSNVVVRREIAIATGGFDTRLRVLADWDLWLRLTSSGPPAVVHEPLVAYRIHRVNMSGDPRGVLAELALIEAKSAAARGGADLGASWVHRWMGDAALRGGHRGAAAAAYWRAARAERRGLAKVGAAIVAPPGAWRLARRVRGRKQPPSEPPPTWLAQLLDSGVGSLTVPVED